MGRKTEPDFHNLKHRLIAIKEQDDAIEAFSSNLNIRNKHLDDDQFEEKNDNSIADMSLLGKLVSLT